MGTKTAKPAFVGSPLNYTGGKFRLLPQLVPLFPTDIRNFHDVFCGGANVLANVEAKGYTGRDIQPDLVRLLAWLARTPGNAVLAQADALVEQYGLSRTDLHGYAHYGADSSTGLADVNRAAYGRLRAGYAPLRAATEQEGAGLAEDNAAAAHFLVLLAYAFNNQIRFGKNGYNIPVGKRDLNGKQRQKILAFAHALEQRNVRFACESYDALDLGSLNSQDLVYADPPYLISTASYNEAGGWDEVAENKLLGWLDEVHATGARFALSNVLTHKGRTNTLLDAWCKARGWRVERVSASYANASYHGKHKDGGAGTQEVLILNY